MTPYQKIFTPFFYHFVGATWNQYRLSKLEFGVKYGKGWCANNIWNDAYHIIADIWQAQLYGILYYLLKGYSYDYMFTHILQCSISGLGVISWFLLWSSPDTYGYNRSTTIYSSRQRSVGAIIERDSQAYLKINFLFLSTLTTPTLPTVPTWKSSTATLPRQNSPTKSILKPVD